MCTKNNIEIIYHVDRLCIKENGHSIRHNNVQTDGWGLSFCMYICLYDVWMLVGKIYIQSNSGMLYSLSLYPIYLSLFCFFILTILSASLSPHYLLHYLCLHLFLNTPTLFYLLFFFVPSHLHRWEANIIKNYCLIDIIIIHKP